MKAPKAIAPAISGWPVSAKPQIVIPDVIKRRKVTAPFSATPSIVIPVFSTEVLPASHHGLSGYELSSKVELFKAGLPDRYMVIRW